MYTPKCRRRYIYYKVKALCVKTWDYCCQAGNIYELEKTYFYKSINEGYSVNGYALSVINPEGVRCSIAFREPCFKQYFIEIPGTYSKH